MKVEVVETEASGKLKQFGFKPEKPHKEGEKEFYEYLVSIELEPGSYTLGEVYARAGDGVIISGWFRAHVNGKFDLPAGSVTCLGHVLMVNRERREGEPSAGGVFSLIDQPVTGFAGGALDITVTDRSDTDIPAFVEAYPSLKEVNLRKTVMKVGK